ncbi:hypothetical protein LCGC14_2778270, partial [marine sediment metagenome]
VKCPDCLVEREIHRRTLSDCKRKGNTICHKCKMKRATLSIKNIPGYLNVIDWNVKKEQALVECPYCQKRFSKKREEIRSTKHSICLQCFRRNIQYRDCHVEDIEGKIIVLEQYHDSVGNSARSLVKCPFCKKKRVVYRQYILDHRSTICVCCSSRNRAGEKHPQWKGGHRYYYGHEWERIAKSIRERDGLRCMYPECTKIGKSLHVHHIKPYRISRDNSANNLITLCRKHHLWADRNLKDSVDMLREIVSRLENKHP